MKEKVQGKYSATRHSYGFIEADGFEDDFFVSGSDANGALNGDIVEFEISARSKGRRKCAVVTQISERAIKSVVGTYEKTGSYGFVVSDNPYFEKDILVAPTDENGARNGLKVLCEIISYGDKRRIPEGRITEVIGDPQEKGCDVMCVAKSAGLPMDFPKDVSRAAAKARDVGVPESEVDRRLDLRDTPMITIDGEDSKDLDDAVSLKMQGDKYLLGVHIADVSHYVTEGSALDREALLRGTSVYFVDRVIPMLPVELSNDICSLNAGCDRLTLSCIMTIDSKGRIIDHRIAESVINVDERMTYTDVNRLLKGAGKRKKYADVLDMIMLMGRLSEILHERRTLRGSIDFDLPQTKVYLDADGFPEKIVPYETNAATLLIEEFMLAANETVAEDFCLRQVPFVYRNHDRPSPDKMSDLKRFLANLGYGIRLSGKSVQPVEIAKLLDRSKGRPEESLISMMTLRSMQRAQYSPVCNGHFGLAAKYYCHFTSPIRRYPDLQIHRIIKETLKGKMDAERSAHYEKILPAVAKRSSDRERLADEVERETVRMKMCEYMELHIGDEFDGTVGSLTSWGIYVVLPESTIEGLMAFDNMSDDRYRFYEKRMEVRGDRYGGIFRIGDSVRVKVTGADKGSRTIDFVPVGKPSGKARGSGNGKKRRHKAGSK